MRPARRLWHLPGSAIRQFCGGAPQDAIHLGLGEFQIEMPEIAHRALERYGGVSSYGPQEGRLELRQAIADHAGVEVQQVLVTVGAQEAFFSLCQAWIDPGDQVLVPDPGFPGYGGAIRMAGGTPVAYPLGSDSEAPSALRTGDRDFSLSASRLLTLLDVTPQARMVVLNLPSNPTGAGASLEDLEEVASACEDRGILLVSDEVYRELSLGKPVPSLRTVSPRAVVIDSISKSFACAGLRLGWVSAPEDILAPLRVTHGWAVTAAASPAQWAAKALLKGKSEVLPPVREELAHRWQLLSRLLRQELGWQVTIPSGGLYAFLPLGPLGIKDDLAYCCRLRDEAGVVLLPGSLFGEEGRGFARLSFGASPEDLREGVARLARFGETP